MHPIAFLLAGKGTKDQVSYLSSAKNSSLIACFQFFFCKASLTDVGRWRQLILSIYASQILL